MGVLHMPTAAGHHPLKSCPRHEAPPTIILKSVTFTMTTDSPPRAPPQVDQRRTGGCAARATRHPGSRHISHISHHTKHINTRGRGHRGGGSEMGRGENVHGVIPCSGAGGV